MEGRADETKQILVAIAEIQTNMKNMSKKIDEISKISTMVFESDQRSKSAHNRIDDLKADFAEKLQQQKEDYEEKLADQKANFAELKSNITWLWRAVGGGAISLVFGVLLFYLTRGG